MRQAAAGVHRRLRRLACPLVVVAALGVGCAGEPAGPAPSPVMPTRVAPVPSGAAGLLPHADPGPDPAHLRAALAAYAIRQRAPGGELAGLGLTELAYRLDDASGAAPTTDRAGTAVAAVLRYRLHGEPAALELPVTLTLVRRSGTWQVERAAGVGRALLWQVGRPRVVAGAATTVIGVGDAPGGWPALRWWARAGDQVGREVRAAVGAGAGRLTVVVPRDAADLARLTGRAPGSVTGLAGLALAELGVPGEPSVQRVYLNSSLLAGTSSLVRRIVLRHEAAHVVLDAPSSATPTWLEEGMAEYLGYRGTGVPPAVAARGLLERVRSGRTWADPPGASDFAGARVELAYQAAYLLVAEMVRRVGLDRALRVYRLSTRDGQEAAAWRTVTGTSWAGLLAGWRAGQRRLAGG